MSKVQQHKLVYDAIGDHMGTTLHALMLTTRRQKRDKMTKVNQKISKLIESDNVVLFMKGTPDFPQCGFSANVIGILNYFGIKFSSFKIDGNKGPEFNNYIIHKMSKNLSDLVVRFNRNTSLHSEEIKKQITV